MIDRFWTGITYLDLKDNFHIGLLSPVFRSVKASKGNINSRSTSSRSFDESWWTGGENVRGSRKCQGAVWAVGEWVGQGRPLLLQVTTPLAQYQASCSGQGVGNAEGKRSESNQFGWLGFVGRAHRHKLAETCRSHFLVLDARVALRHLFPFPLLPVNQ